MSVKFLSRRLRRVKRHRVHHRVLLRNPQDISFLYTSQILGVARDLDLLGVSLSWFEIGHSSPDAEPGVSLVNLVRRD